MATTPLRVMLVLGSLREGSITRVVMLALAERLHAAGCDVDVVDLSIEPLPLYNPDTATDQPVYAALRDRVVAADVFVLGTPDYHGSISSPMKNFLDHFWHEFAGKLFATLVASHEKGLTAIDQLRTVARQCYAWTLPYGVSFAEAREVSNGKIVSAQFEDRLTMLERDLRIYGALLARQRRADLAGADPGFLARLRVSD